MPHKHADKFPKTQFAVLERDGSERDSDEDIYVSFEGEKLKDIRISESPRLVATYRLVKVQMLVKKHRIEVVKQPKRRSKK